MAAPLTPVLSPPAAVICDLDGTLVDTVLTRIEAWMRTFAETGLPADRDHVASLIGSDGKWLAERVAERTNRSLTADEAEAIDRRAGEQYGALNTDPRPLPGAGEFLDALDAAGSPWAVATSSRPAQVQVSLAALRREARPVVVDGLAVERAKPEPDLLLAAADRLAARPSDCWCVGDARWDMLAAVAAAMVPVGVITGAASAADLRDAGAVAVVDRLDDLIGLLRPA
ncbi:MAG: HAD family phosphatase [Chloroflexi bacterium]|nr:MAG: HAD family phosphatase [Chloroflexota bacterium]